MNRFRELDTSILIEMLAQHTSQLTALLVRTVRSKEYEGCKKIIEEIQSEIYARTDSSTHTGFTDQEISVGIQ